MMLEENRQDKTQAVALLAHAEQLCVEYFQSLSSEFNSVIIENTDSFLAGNRRAIIEISLNSLIHTETKRSLLWYFSQHMGLSELALKHLLSDTDAKHSYQRQQRDEAVDSALNETIESYQRVFSAELFALELRFRSLRKHAAARTNAEPWVPGYSYSVFRLWLKDMGLGDKFAFELLKFFDQAFCDSYADFLLSLNTLFSEAEILPTTFSANHAPEDHKPVLKENFKSIEALFTDAQWEVTTATDQAAKASKKDHGIQLQDGEFRKAPGPNPFNERPPSDLSLAKEPSQNTLSPSHAFAEGLSSNARPHEANNRQNEASHLENSAGKTNEKGAHHAPTASEDSIADIDRGTVLDFLDNANNWQRRKVISFDRDTREYILAGNGSQEHRSEAEIMDLYQAQKLRILSASDAPKGIYARIKERLRARRTGSESAAKGHKTREKTTL